MINNCHILTDYEDILASKPAIELPRLVDTNLHAINNIAKNIRKLHMGDSGVLIVDDITYKIIGKKAEQIMIDDKLEIQLLKIKTATMDYVNQAVDLYKEIGAKFSIGAGGGTVIDVSKYSSFLNDIPFVSVPTAASHDGIASTRASIKGDGSSSSYSARSPLLVIGDVDTLSKAPSRFAISGASDLISNKSAVLDWDLSRRITGEKMSQYAAILSTLTADEIITDQQSIAKDVMYRTYTTFKALIASSAAMCIAGSSRPASGSEHLISHRMDQMFNRPAMHGEQVGVATIFTMYLHGKDWKEIRDALKTIGAPTTAKELGLTDDNMIQAILNAQSIKPERFTILSAGISEKAVCEGLSKTKII